MQARIVLPILSALGLATALLAAAPQGTTTLNEHELEGCEVIISPIGQRKVPVSVMYEEPVGSPTPRFEVMTAKTGVVSITDAAAVAAPKPLTGGKDIELVFTYDQATKAFDVVVKEAGTKIADWPDTPLRGIYDRLGPFKGAYAENVRHPTDTTGKKKAIKVWFDDYGVQGSFLLIDP